jgi:hypothetical protein
MAYHLNLRCSGFSVCGPSGAHTQREAVRVESIIDLEEEQVRAGPIARIPVHMQKVDSLVATSIPKLSGGSYLLHRCPTPTLPARYLVLQISARKPAR